MRGKCLHLFETNQMLKPISGINDFKWSIIDLFIDLFIDYLKINEFSVDKTLLTEDNKTYEEFQTALDMQPNGFLKKFFDYKFNQNELSPNEPRIKRPKIDMDE